MQKLALVLASGPHWLCKFICANPPLIEGMSTPCVIKWFVYNGVRNEGVWLLKLPDSLGSAILPSVPSSPVLAPPYSIVPAY